MGIITSLLDTDLYKLSMQMVVLHRFPTAEVKYKFICRNKEVDLRPYIPQIKKEIEHLCNLRFTAEELDYLRTFSFFKKDYIDFLEDFSMKKRTIKVFEENENMALEIKGSWLQTILFEVPILAIISEVYMSTKKPKGEAFFDGIEIANKKIDIIKSCDVPFKMVDFGTRRRYSRYWHETIIKYYKNTLGKDIFVGTSNLLLSKTLGLDCFGTMAHEYISAGMGLGKVPLVDSQRYMLETWLQEYRGNLGIALTDTISMDAFLLDFRKYYAELYHGCRHDSGDPYVWGEKLIAHYKKLNIDPLTKTAVFSDGLDPEKAIALSKYFHGRINTSFGIGTNITNDVGVKPLSIVLKMVKINGNFVAKISDEPAKAICEDTEFLKNLKKVFKVTCD